MKKKQHPEVIYFRAWAERHPDVSKVGNVSADSLLFVMRPMFLCLTLRIECGGFAAFSEKLEYFKN